MRILLLTAHSIAEYDDLRMLTDLGADTFSIGAYTLPDAPGDRTRPPLDSAPTHPDLAALCALQRERYAELPAEWHAWAVDPAKADLHPEIIEWADVVICHHYLDRWIIPQWAKLRGKRVIWRTCGQSDPDLELAMSRLRADGLQIVRYSPREREAFEGRRDANGLVPGTGTGTWAGSDAMIPFGKYPSDYPEWTGDWKVVGNVTQDLPGRGAAVGLGFWRAATANLPAVPAGGGSEKIGGTGFLSYPAMLDYLRRIRAYLYLGTAPASYTLGLIEAMMVGVPVLSIAAESWAGPAELFDGADLAGYSARTPEEAEEKLRQILEDDGYAELLRTYQRRSARRFHMENVAPMWGAFLGIPQRHLSIEVFK